MNITTLTLLRGCIHLGCLAPLIWLVQVLLLGDESVFGADPIKELEHFLGYTAILIFSAMFVLGFLLQALQKNHLQILRRPLGLWAFFWASLHIISYLALELNLEFRLFIFELFTRPYLTLGAIAFLILLAMAISSIPTIKTALGKHWFQLHKLAYLAITLACVHYYWSVKSLTLAPIMVGILVAGILIWKWVR